jgi:hypothetical protein
MRRLLLVFLLMIFPFQVSWAAASVYCAHEAAPAAVHPGHHQLAPDGEAGSNQQGEASPKIDFDCGDCHFTSVGITATTAANATPPPMLHGSVAGLVLVATMRPARPERPKWQRAA